MISIAIRALGMALKGLDKTMEELEVRWRIDIIQVIVKISWNT